MEVTNIVRSASSTGTPCKKCFGMGGTVNHRIIGNAFKGERLKLRPKVKLKDFADKIRVESSLLSYLESGKRSWTMELVKDYANAINELRHRKSDQYEDGQ